MRILAVIVLLALMGCDGKGKGPKESAPAEADSLAVDEVLVADSVLTVP